VSRRGATALRGVLAVDKPAGMTSHDVVSRVRRATGEGRVGHAGTLDPAATGLLVVLIGPYTRLEPYLTCADKSYEARIAWGAETDTDDAEGTVVRACDTPADLFDEQTASGALAGLMGRQLQTPPAFSALKVAGRVAHRAARAGAPLELQPREIEVFEARLISTDATDGTWDVFFRVSKGTYVRALARDLGRTLGTAAHLAGLRRTASGALSLADAHTLEDVEAATAAGRLADLLTDPLGALGLPTLEAGAGATRTGAALARGEAPSVLEGAFVAVTEDGRLAAIYAAAGCAFLPMVVIPDEGAA
jgi:tRNA pseudouridine55 synthase